MIEKEDKIITPTPTQNETDEEWDLVIKPKDHLLDVNLKEIWHYRDLLMLFVKRDFVAQYKQTILGPAWHIIQPIFSTAIFVLMFGKIAGIPSDGIRPILFYMSGLTMWNYFSTCLNSVSSTFVNNAPIFGKIYFPRLVLPLSVIVSNVVKFTIQFLVLLVMMLYYHFYGFPLTISHSWLWIPLFVFVMAALALGFGIILSAISTKYRDFVVVLNFAVQLWMFITPVVYPLSFVKNYWYVQLIKLNPLTGVVEGFRYALYQKGNFTWGLIGYSAAFAAVILFIGLIMFNRVQKTFMDTV